MTDISDSEHGSGSPTLPEGVRVVELDGRVVYLVGTAHVSQASVEDVRKTIEQVRPDSVCVELCEGRYRTLVQQKPWRQMDIFQVLRERKALLLLAQLTMSSFYRRIGNQLGVRPGAEMLEGARLAQEYGAETVLADRPIDITLKRVWGHLSLLQKMRLAMHLLMSMLVAERIDDELVENLKNRDQLESVMDEFARQMPQVRERLIDERDTWLAQKIREAKGRRIVAVVGAGHMDGVVREMAQEKPLEPLASIPPRSVSGQVIKWGVPAAIVALLVAGFFKEGADHSLTSLGIWVAVNGILSAIGAAAALGHPLTVLTALVAAPLTSLNPFVAAGWVAGFVQALVKKPTVADFEDLPNAISSFKGFWSNPVSRVLLVVALANLGSSLGTFISGGWLAARLM